MKDIHSIGADVLDDVRRKKARAALDGIVGLLYATHTPDEVTEMLKSAYEEARHSP